MLLFQPGLLHLSRRDIPLLLAMGGISIGVFHVFWNLNILWNGAALATVIQSNAPIFVTILAWIFWRESLTSSKLLAIGLAIIGTGLVARVDLALEGTISSVGIMIGLVSAFLYSLFNLFSKKLRGNYQPLTILVWSFAFAALALFPFQFTTAQPKLSLPVLSTFMALVMIPTILGFWLYTYALGRLPVSVASIVATTEVPFAALYAFLALDERMDIWQVIGALLIVGGVVLVSTPGRNKITGISHSPAAE